MKIETDNKRKLDFIDMDIATYQRRIDEAYKKINKISGQIGDYRKRISNLEKKKNEVEKNGEENKTKFR